MPCYAEERPYCVFDRDGKGKFVLEHPDCQYDGNFIGNRYVYYAGGYAVIGQCRRSGWVLRRRQYAFVCRFGNRMAESAERIQADCICAGMVVLLV